MIISKFQYRNQLIILRTGQLINSSVIYFYVEVFHDSEEKGIIDFRSFIFDDALDHYLSIIKICLDCKHINDFTPKTEEDFK